MKFALQDQNNNALVNPRINLTDPMSVSSSQLLVQTDTAFNTVVRIRGYTLSRNTNFDFRIRVCGEETVSVVSAAVKTFIFGFSPGDPA